MRTHKKKKDQLVWAGGDEVLRLREMMTELDQLRGKYKNACGAIFDGGDFVRIADIQRQHLYGAGIHDKMMAVVDRCQEELETLKRHRCALNDMDKATYERAMLTYELEGCMKKPPTDETWLERYDLARRILLCNLSIDVVGERLIAIDVRYDLQGMEAVLGCDTKIDTVDDLVVELRKEIKYRTRKVSVTKIEEIISDMLRARESLVRIRERILARIHATKK